MLKIGHRFLSAVRSPRLSYRPLGVEAHDPRKLHWGGHLKGRNEACFFPEWVGGFPWVDLPRRSRRRRGDEIRGLSSRCSIFTLPIGHRSCGPRKPYFPSISAERTLTQGSEGKLVSKEIVGSNGYSTQRSRNDESVPSAFRTDTARREFEVHVISLGRNSHWNRIICAYKEALDDPDLELSGSMYKATIAALSGRNRWREALMVMRDMQTAGFDPDVGVFNHVIRACIASSQVERAFSLFDEMKAGRVAPNATTYHHLLKGCRGGMWERALDLLSAMEESGLGINTNHFNSVIAACGSSGELERALGIFHEMRTRRVRPTHGTYREAILACEKGGQWERALSLLGWMVHDNLVPNDYCYNAAIDVCLAAKRWSEAFTLLEQALSDDENTDTMNFEGVALACAEAGEVDEARELVRKMRAARRVVTQNLLDAVNRAAASDQQHLQGNGKAGAKVSPASKARVGSYRYSRAPGRDLVHGMRDEGGAGSAMRELAEGENKGAENDNASSPKGKPVRLWSPPYTERKFVQCVNACSNRGRRRTLIHLLKDAMTTPGLRFTVHMYESALRSFAKLGMPRQAVGALGWMRESGLTPSSRCIVWAIRACSETRPVNTNLAVSLLKEMNPPDTFGYAAVLSVHASGRQWKKALSLLDEMPAAGVQPNGHCYGAAMAACYRATPARWKEALGLLERMKAQGLQPNGVVYDTAIRACLSGDQGEAARGLVDEMLDKGYTPFPELMTRVAIASSS